MDKPKINEVWRSRAGNLCIIVSDTKMIWYDTIDQDVVISEILSRLDYRTDFSTTSVFKIWFGS